MNRNREPNPRGPQGTIGVSVRTILWFSFVFAVFIGLLSGCASVTNPYVAPAKDFFTDSREGTPPPPRSLDAAIWYAEDTRDKAEASTS